MNTLIPPTRLTPQDVERVSEREGRLYELVDGELREKRVGFWEMFIANRIVECLNQHFYPSAGAAACEVMIYCFERPDHGRKPDVVFFLFERFAGHTVPDGDLHVTPELVVEVLSPSNASIEMERKLREYLEAGIPLVWMISPEARTIRAYRQDGTTQLFRENDMIEDEPALPGFRMRVGDVFPRLGTPAA